MRLFIKIKCSLPGRTNALALKDKKHSFKKIHSAKKNMRLFIKIKCSLSGRTNALAWKDKKHSFIKNTLG